MSFVYLYGCAYSFLACGVIWYSWWW